MSYKYADLTTLQELVTKTKALLTDYYLKTETYSQTEVNNLIAGITTITYEIVQTLPTASATTYFNDSKKVYMLRNSASTGTDFYEEYITLRSGSAGSYTYSWELIGTTQIDLSGYVPTSRKVNNKALTADITLTASDVGAVPTTRTVNSKALSSDITLTASDVSAVPTTRTVNSKALSSDITLSASDVGAVPTTRTVNSKALSADITLSASDVGAEPTISTKGSAFNRDFEDTDANIQMNGTGDAGTSNKVARADHVHPSDTTRVPTSRKVNNKALSSDITLDAGDVGAVPTTRKVNNKALSSDITLNADDISDTSTTNKFVTATEKSTWSGKQDAITSSNKLGADLVDDGSSSNKFIKTLDGASVTITSLNAGVYILVNTATGAGDNINIITDANDSTSGSTCAVKQGTIINVARFGDVGWEWWTLTEEYAQSLYVKKLIFCRIVKNGSSAVSYTTKKVIDNIATTSDIPTKTSDIINDGSDGTSTYVEDDELVAITTAEVDALF